MYSWFPRDGIDAQWCTDLLDVPPKVLSQYRSDIAIHQIAAKQHQIGLLFVDDANELHLLPFANQGPQMDI